MAEYYVAHDREYQKEIWRGDVPEVYHGDRDLSTKLTEAWQWLIFNLNPGITEAGFTSLLKYDRAFTNYTGFGALGRERANYIKGENLDCQLPRWDKWRLCGGTKIRGKYLGGNRLLVETLNGLKRPPSVSWVRARPWLFFEALIVKWDGSTQPFPQNGGNPVWVPLLASGPAIVKIGVKRVATPYPYLMVRS